MIKVSLGASASYNFSYEKIFEKFAYFMQVFQEERKKTWFSTRYLANFQKNFMPNCSPSIFTYTYVLISKSEKNFFRIFSVKQSKSLRNYFLIIFKQFPAIFGEICIFFVEKFNFFD